MRCTKPNCVLPGAIHRHHKRHEAMWFGIWRDRRRGETAWECFVQRYYEFRPEDCIQLCEQHHAEIHMLYDKIIIADRQRTKKFLASYSWRQALALMNKLEVKCNRWLTIQTPGIQWETLAELRDNGTRKR